MEAAQHRQAPAATGGFRRLLNPGIAGRIRIKDWSGDCLGDWDAVPWQHGHVLSNEAGECWQVDRSAKTKPMLLRAGLPNPSIFRFEEHPSGGFAIRGPDGCFVSREPVLAALLHRWRPVGWKRLTTNRPVPKAWEEFGIEILRADEHLTRFVEIPYQPFFENREWVVDLMRRHRGQRNHCTVATVGDPKVGKSTLLNCLSSMIAGVPAPIVSAGGQDQLNGHLTLWPQRVRLIEAACEQCGREAPTDLELTVCDLVGMRSPAELRCALLGKMRPGELWPTTVWIDHRVEERRMPARALDRLVQGIESRAASPDAAAHCMFLLVGANTLTSMGPTSEAASHLQQMQQVASSYTANTTRVWPLPVRLIITQVDPWAREHHIADSGCLLGGSAGLLKPLYDAAFQKLGFAANDVTPIGWLNSDEINYANATDPRVVVLKLLLCQAVQQGCQYAGKVSQQQVAHHHA